MTKKSCSLHVQPSGTPGSKQKAWNEPHFWQWCTLSPELSFAQWATKRRKRQTLAQRVIAPPLTALHPDNPNPKHRQYTQCSTINQNHSLFVKGTNPKNLKQQNKQVRGTCWEMPVESLGTSITTGNEGRCVWKICHKQTAGWVWGKKLFQRFSNLGTVQTQPRGPGVVTGCPTVATGGHCTALRGRLAG